MKYIYFCIFLIFLLEPIYCIAGESHIQDKSSLGIFGGAIIKPAIVNREFSLLAGARIALVFNKKIEAGIGFYNLLTSNIEAAYFDTTAKRNPYLHCDYFGLETGYILNPESDFQYYFKSLFGGGRAAFIISARTDKGEIYSPQFDDDWFFIVEPALGLYYKMTTWAKAGACIEYRFNFGLDYTFFGEHFSSWDLSGLGFHVSLNLGNF